MSSSTDDLVQSIAYDLPSGSIAMVIRDQANRCSNSGSKRLMDIVLSTSALIILSPVLAFIALGIFVQDRGPVFFRQERAGMNGETFRIWKFRTMTVQPPTSSFQQTMGKDDPRVTTLGRWLRVSSLDELPQLFNILKGEMSLVGPRPHPVELDKIYAPQIDKYVLRRSVRPGLTGAAQITGARGAIAGTTEMKTRLELDLAYITNWSFLGDFVILFQTLNLRKMMANAH
ncbi:MAG: sugar transferase [Roseibium sp.]